ncbi:hypothetical protein JCM8547_002711 [Rhodosporidiobolus lusitaniae]
MAAENAHMRSLRLSSQLHPSSPLLKSGLVTIRDDPLGTCASRKINIIWRMNSKEPVHDIGVSKEFWAYAKELKRKKAIEAEGGAGGGGSA